MKKNNYAAMAAGIALFVMLFVFSEQFTQGISAGLSNCAKIVIPSLFPFMIAASLSGSGGMPKPLKKIFEPITQLLFRMPSDCLPAVILGLFGGYLSGAKAAESLYSNGVLTKSQANRLLLFCVNAGMGFSVNAVGNALLGSREAGKVLLASLCISSLILGIISRFLPDTAERKNAPARKIVPFSAAVVDSVSQGSQAMLTACAFVAVFSGIGAVADGYITSAYAKTAVSCLLEVTKGCIDIAGKASLPLIAAVCAFGGVCVHMQIFSLSQTLSPNLTRFYIFRVLHSVMACAVCKIILHFHPIERQVFLSVSTNAAAVSFSIPSAISLLFLCALLILDLDNNKKVC